MKLTPAENIIISDKDRAQCLGSGELKPCPFCGNRAISAGTKNEQSGNTVYRVICTSLGKCGATVHVCQKDPEQARREAINQWNRRAPNQTLQAIREMVSRFLIAHRDTHRNWIEAFVECGAITADFNYHPLYPFIKPEQEPCRYCGEADCEDPNNCPRRREHIAEDENE